LADGAERERLVRTGARSPANGGGWWRPRDRRAMSSSWQHRGDPGDEKHVSGRPRDEAAMFGTGDGCGLLPFATVPNPAIWGKLVAAFAGARLEATTVASHASVAGRVPMPSPVARASGKPMA